jgi:hypothetical protein
MSTGLPKVTVNLGNGNLNQTLQTDDGVVGLVITGVAVSGSSNVSTGEAYQIFSLVEAEDLGITEDSTNSFAWKQIRDFYSIAKTGAELWFMLITSTVTMETAADENEDYAAKLLTKAKGRVKQLAISRKSTGTVTAANGLDEDVHNAVPKAQQLAESFASRNRPLRILLDGKDFTGTISDLKDYAEDNKNRVAIMIGNNDGSKNASVGLFLGRKAASPVHYNPGRVKDGAIIDLEAFFTDGSNVEDLEAGWDAIHNKGYIFFKSFTGRAGYYFTHAISLTKPTDDYKKLPYGWVIDKVHVLAYQTYVDEILEVIPIAENGQVHPALIKSWESKIETTINQQMTANGEVSGVEAYINPNQPILSSGELKIDLKILPVGYAEYIPINIGFTTTLNT